MPFFPQFSNLFVPPFVPLSLTSGLLAYWNLDSNSWSDSSGNGWTLTNNNLVTNATGIINDGALFDGVNQTLTTSFQNITGDFSVSLWVKSADTANQQTFFDSSAYISLNIYFINQALSVNNYVLVSDINEVGSFSNDTWYHIVITKNNGTVSAYSDAGILASTEQNIEILEDGVGIGGSSFLNDYYLNGMVDEVGVWTRALSESEITTLYNNGNGLSYPF